MKKYELNKVYCDCERLFEDEESWKRHYDRHIKIDPTHPHHKLVD